MNKNKNKNKENIYGHLKRKLVLMYGGTSTLILTVVLTAILIFWIAQDRSNELNAFDRSSRYFTEQVQQMLEIKHSWIKQLEAENGWLLRFYENDVDLNLPDGSENNERLDGVFDQLNVVLEKKEPLFYSVMSLNGLKTSDTHLVHMKDGREYYGKVILIKYNSSQRTIMLLHRLPAMTGRVLRHGRFLMMCLVFGTMLLFAFSYYYVRYVVRPVEEANAKQKEFIASVSHELRSPLAVLQVGVGSMKKELNELEDGKKLKRYLYPMEGECVRMNRLIEDMLLLAATDQKNWTIRTESVDVETLLIDCYDAFSMMNQEHQNQIQIDLSENSLPTIQGDAQRIKQVIMILLDNAMSYTNLADGITLRAYERNQEICIEVEDHGEGMSDAEKKKIFDRFYRREGSRSDRRHFGLGLSIAKRLIELHHGTIEVKDTKGQGTTFVIHLPV